MTKKEQAQIGVIVGCLIAIGLIVGRQMTVKKTKPVKNSDTTSGVPSFAHAREQQPAEVVKFELLPLSEEIVKKQHALAQGPWGRNPFVVVSTRSPLQEGQCASPLDGLSISAVVMNGDSGMALVGDQLIKSGDTLRGYKVTKVNMNGILLEKEGAKVSIPYGK